MHIVITNNSPAPTVVMSRDEGGWVEPLPQALSTTVGHYESDTMLIGEKPTVTKEILENLKVETGVIQAWRNRPKVPTPLGQPGEDPIAVVIANNGNKPIRIITNKGKLTNDLAPGVSYQATSLGYIEIREQKGE